MKRKRERQTGEQAKSCENRPLQNDSTSLATLYENQQKLVFVFSFFFFLFSFFFFLFSFFFSRFSIIFIFLINQANKLLFSLLSLLSLLFFLLYFLKSTNQID
jgi:hypothetical protein